jgi:hypothetical protein
MGQAKRNTKKALPRAKAPATAARKGAARGGKKVAPPPEKAAGASAKRPSRARKPTAAETGGEEDGSEPEDDTATENEDDAESGDVVDLLSPDVHFMKTKPPSGASKHWYVPNGSVPGKGGIKDANLGGGGTVKVRNKGAKIEGIYAVEPQSAGTDGVADLVQCKHLDTALGSLEVGPAEMAALVQVGALMSPADLERLAGWAPEGMSRMRDLKGEEAQGRLMTGVGKGWTPLLYAAVVYEEADTRLAKEAKVLSAMGTPSSFEKAIERFKWGMAMLEMASGPPGPPVKERGRRKSGAGEEGGRGGADIAKVLEMSAEASAFSKQDDGKMANILSKRGGLSKKARTGEGAQALAHALAAGAKSRHVAQLMSDAHDTTYKVDKYVTTEHIGAVLRLKLDKELFLALRSVQALGPLTMADCARALERITLIDRALKMGAFEGAGGLRTLFRELTPGINDERRDAGDPELAGLLVDHVAKHGRKAAAARNRGVVFESTLGDIDRSTRQQLDAFTLTWTVYLDAVERSAAARRTAGVKDTDPPLGGKRKAWEDDKGVDKGVHGDKDKPGKHPRKSKGQVQGDAEAGKDQGLFDEALRLTKSTPKDKQATTPCYFKKMMERGCNKPNCPFLHK